MKIFIAGGQGFIGRNVSDVLESQGHDVYRSSRSPINDTTVVVDLLNSAQVLNVLKETKPEIIINCAGVVSPEGNFEDNIRISENLIEAVAAAGIDLYRLVVCGSAGEYGNISPDQWPVRETATLHAVNPYPQSKIAEEQIVHALSQQYHIDAVVARIFNPIGSGMPSKFLISNIVKQVNEIKAGNTDSIYVGRIDALRDYVDISDVSKALAILATQPHKYDVYNIGSGVATLTEEVVRCIIEESGVTKQIAVKETASEPELPVASQADISRLRNEFGWTPEVSLRQTIRGVINDELSSE